MKFFNLIPYYLSWHYTAALGSIMKIWTNYIWFISNYFSFKTILISFFRPYKKLTESNYDNAGSENIIVSSIMKFVGVVLRLGVILTGSIIYSLNLLFGFLVFVLWLMSPLILTVFFMMGIIALIY